MPGIDGPHNYTNSITLSKIKDPRSSSDGPAPAGPMHNEETASSVPDAAQFAAAHGQARGSGYDAWGMYTAPTTPGQLGNSAMFPSPEPHFSSNMEATDVTHVGGMPGPAAYNWPDATGGGLGNSSDEFKR